MHDQVLAELRHDMIPEGAQGGLAFDSTRWAVYVKYLPKILAIVQRLIEESSSKSDDDT